MLGSLSPPKPPRGAGAAQFFVVDIGVEAQLIFLRGRHFCPKMYV